MPTSRVRTVRSAAGAKTSAPAKTPSAAKRPAVKSAAARARQTASPSALIDARIAELGD